MRAEPSQQDEELRSLTRWRRRELLRAGYDLDAARLLAEAQEVDLHMAVTMLRRGCDSSTALRILL